jgi:hypothetical protein
VGGVLSVTRTRIQGGWKKSNIITVWNIVKRMYYGVQRGCGAYDKWCEDER